jgi:SAM-dependent methyltransferase
VKYAVLSRHHGYRLAKGVSRSATFVAALLGPYLRNCAAMARPIRFGGSGRLLDVGCGNGAALSRYRELGWATYGIEVSRTSAALAARAGHDVRVGQLVGANYPASFFAAVTLWDALEHIHNPAETMREVFRVLQPGGRVYISVPNAGSIYFRAFRDKWFMFTAPLHYYHYTKGTLAHLLEHCGFRLVRLVTTFRGAGLQQTISAVCRSRRLLHGVVESAPVRCLLSRLEVVAPWGHLAAVGERGYAGREAPGPPAGVSETGRVGA